MVILGFTYHSLLLLLFNHQVMSDSATPWTAACQVSLPLTIFRSLLKFMSIELVKLSTISSSSAPFSFCLQSFPASESFPMSWFFALGSQSIGTSASASVLPMSIQGWFPLGLTGLISLLSKRHSGVFSALQFESTNSLSLSLESERGEWKNWLKHSKN